MKYWHCLLILVSASFNLAQEPSPPESMSIKQLIDSEFDKLNKARATSTEENKGTLAATQESKLKEQKTGANSFANEFEGNIKDFLPLASGVLEGYDKAADGESLTLNFNIPKFLKNLGTVQLQAQFVNPKLLDSVIAQLPEINRDTQVSALEDSLQENDSMVYSLSVNLEKGPFGRKWDDSKREAFQRLMDQSVEESVSRLQSRVFFDIAKQTAILLSIPSLRTMIDPEKLQDWEKKIQLPNKRIHKVIAEQLKTQFNIPDEAFKQIWEKVDDEYFVFTSESEESLEGLLSSLSENGLIENNEEFKSAILNNFLEAYQPAQIREDYLSLTTLTDLDPCKRDAFLVQLKTFAKSEVNYFEALEAGFRRDKLDDFNLLVNNQPQLHFTLANSQRASIVGQNSWILRGTYEFFGKNFNKFQKKLRTNTNGELDLDIYREFVQEGNHSHRFALNFEYEDLQERSINLETLTSPLLLEADTKFKAELSYGFYLSVKEGKGLDRLDLSAAFEDYDLQTQKRNRFISSMTYTPKPGKWITFPISLRYANHGEYLTDTEDEFSAHFGISFKSN